MQNWIKIFHKINSWSLQKYNNYLIIFVLENSLFCCFLPKFLKLIVVIAFIKLLMTMWMVGDICLDVVTTNTYLRYWKDPGSFKINPTNSTLVGNSYYFYAAMSIWALTPMFYTLFSYPFIVSCLFSINDSNAKEATTKAFLRLHKKTPIDLFSWNIFF